MSQNTQKYELSNHRIDMLQKEVMVILNRKNIAPLVHSKKKKKKTNPRQDEQFLFVEAFKKIVLPYPGCQYYLYGTAFSFFFFLFICH